MTIQQYKQKVQNFINSKEISDSQIKNLENIFAGRNNNSKSGKGSKTFKFDDGTSQRIDTYEGRVKAAAKYLNIDDVNELDSLYDVMSTGAYFNSKRGESVDKAFNDVVSQNKNLETIIGDDKFDAMTNSKIINTDDNNILSAVIYQMPITEVRNNFNGKSKSNLGNNFRSLVAGMMATVFLFTYGILPLSKAYAAQNAILEDLSCQKKVNLNYNQVSDSQKGFIDLQTEVIYNAYLEKAKEFNWQVKKGQVLEKRLDELFNYKDIKLNQTELFYLSKAYREANPNFKASQLKIGSHYKNFEDLFEVKPGRDIILDFARRVAFSYGEDFISKKDLSDDPLNNLFTKVIEENTTEIGGDTYNLKKDSHPNSRSDNVQNHIQNLIVNQNDVNPPVKLTFEDFSQFSIFLNSSSLVIPKKSNSWRASSSFLKSIGMPSDNKTISYFLKGIKKLYPNLDLSKIPAGTKLSLKGLSEVRGIGDIFYDKFN